MKAHIFQVKWEFGLRMTRAWLVQHSLLKNHTLWPKMRTRGGRWSQRGRGERDAPRGGMWCPRGGFSPAFQGGCELGVAGFSLWTRLTPGWRAFPLVLLPADLCGPQLLRNASGRVARWRESLSSSSRCCWRLHLQGGATYARELRFDYPLVLRIIKAIYLKKKEKRNKIKVFFFL